MCVSPREAGRDDKADRDDATEGEDDSEWVWEDEEEEGEAEESRELGTDTNVFADPNPNCLKQESPLTTEKLNLVKDIIEKPEDRWRILWQTNRCTGGNCDTPSTASSARFGSNLLNVCRL
jgi:hypothetical protein